MPDAPTAEHDPQLTELEALIDSGDEDAIDAFSRQLDVTDLLFLHNRLTLDRQRALLRHLPEDAAEQLIEYIVSQGDEQDIDRLFDVLPPTETAYLISRLDEAQQTQLLKKLDPEDAADLLEHFIDEQAADFIEELPHHEAAAIFDEMDSDDQADILAELDEEAALAILEKMDPVEAEDARRLFRYGQDTAGGIMITEYLAYRESQAASDVVEDLRMNKDEYVEYDVQYVYVIDQAGTLLGTVKLRDLLLHRGNPTLTSIMHSAPDRVHVEDSLDDLVDFFDKHNMYAVPVVNSEGVLEGVARRAAVQAALGERADEVFMRFGGIVGGEEIRSMPTMERGVRRMAFLLPNILLSYLAVSIIAVYEPTIQKLTALAIFLPMVGNLSGAAGNQAVAVSIRELALGLIRPRDVRRVWAREAVIGLLNGVVIGLVLAVIAFLMRPEVPEVAYAVGGAYVIASVLAVLIGGALPLMLKWVGIDPAMMSSPIPTTLTDMSSFLFVLTIATLALQFGGGS